MKIINALKAKKDKYPDGLPFAKFIHLQINKFVREIPPTKIGIIMVYK